MVAGLRLFVNQIELIGGQSDPVPGELTDPEDGQVFRVYKAYYVPLQDLAAKRPAANTTRTLWAKGKEFTMNQDGYVMPAVAPAEQSEEQAQQSNAPFTEQNELANQIHGK